MIANPKNSAETVFISEVVRGRWNVTPTVKAKVGIRKIRLPTVSNSL